MHCMADTDTLSAVLLVRGIVKGRFRRSDRMVGGLPFWISSRANEIVSSIGGLCFIRQVFIQPLVGRDSPTHTASTSRRAWLDRTLRLRSGQACQGGRRPHVVCGKPNSEANAEARSPLAELSLQFQLC